MALEDGAAPEFGERVAYVVGRGAAGARLVDRCMAPLQAAVARAFAFRVGGSPVHVLAAW